MSLRVEGADDFKKAASALKGLGDKGITRATAKGLRATAKPLGEAMVRAGSAQMPRRGGFSAQVARSRVRVSALIGGKSPRIDIILRSPAGYSLGPLDRGELRHPVFSRAGRPKVWVRQGVPAGAFRDEFERGAPILRRVLVTELTQAIDEVARKV